MKRLLRVLAFFRPDLPKVGLSLGLLVFAIGANLLKPWPIALLADSVLGNKPLPEWLAQFSFSSSKASLLAFLGISVLLLHIVNGALMALQNYWVIGIGLRGLARVREALYERLLRLSQRFHQGRNSGDTLYRATWDTYAFQTLFQQGLMTLVPASLTLLLMLLIMSRADSVLTLFTLLLIPLLVLSIRSFGRVMNARSAEAQQAESQVAGQVQQSLTNLPLIHSYATETREAKGFLALVQAAREKRLGQHTWELLYGLGVTLVFGLGTAMIVWIGGERVLAGKLTLGELLVFLAYLAQLYEPLNQLSHVGSTVSTASASAQRVLDLLDAQEEVHERPDARPVKLESASAKADDGVLEIKGDLQFEHVASEYQAGRKILNNVSFRVKAGESVGIIGPSGAGKSTLLQLVPRFFDAVGGSIKVDGVDIRELKLADWRRSVAFVLQEPLLLPTTVAENIAYGQPEAKREAIIAAAKAAYADEFIRSLPNGYDTIVGEGAARLSVGEKQRLNLARAFLKDAPILLLDEPTSSLDAENEALISASLEQLRKGRTTLVVAHRLQTIRNVNHIIVLQGGRVMEEGSPEELLKGTGYFAKHWPKN
jgi:ATP-binding cassette subfamily B protein